MGPLLRLGRILCIAYPVVVGLAAAFQDELIYFPWREPESSMLARAHEKKLEPWRDKAGTIIGWRRANPQAANRLIVFHGTSKHALHRTGYIETFQALARGAAWEVFLFEYPGFGARTGKLGEDSFVAAAKAAAMELRAADARPIFLLGESLGAGPACGLARELPDVISGMVLVVPFARMQEVAEVNFAFLPVRLIMRDKFDNIGALSNWRNRVAFVVAGRDELISPSQGRKLHAAYAGPKLLIDLPAAGHNTFGLSPETAWVREVDAFLRAPESK